MSNFDLVAIDDAKMRWEESMIHILYEYIRIITYLYD
jgi:hypothetical protein